MSGFKKFYLKYKRIIWLVLILYLVLAAIIGALLFIPGVEDQPFVYQVF